MPQSSSDANTADTFRRPTEMIELTCDRLKSHSALESKNEQSARLTLLRTQICLTQVNPIDHLLEQIVILERIAIFLIVNPGEVLKDRTAL